MPEILDLFNEAFVSSLTKDDTFAILFTFIFFSNVNQAFLQRRSADDTRLLEMAFDLTPIRIHAGNRIFFFSAEFKNFEISFSRIFA